MTTNTIKLTVVAIISILISSCNNSYEKYYPDVDRVVELTDDNMPAVEYFTLEKIDLPEKYAASNYHVYHDSIVIIVNDEHPSPYVVTFYNLNTNQEIAGYFQKGSGPNEVISISSTIRHNNLLISDYSNYGVAKLNIDSVLLKGNDYYPQIYRITDIAIDFDFVNDSIITMINPNYTNVFGVKNSPEFVHFNINTGEPLENYLTEQNFYSGNASNRTFAFNGKEYAVFWQLYPVITIYDSIFNPILAYRDPKFKDPKLGITGQYPMADEIETNSLFFCLLEQTDNNIVVGNSNYQIMRSELSINKIRDPKFKYERNKNYEIWLFDNDFHIRKRYKSKYGLSVTIACSYCEQSGSLYLTTMNKDEDYCLYKCIFEK